MVVGESTVQVSANAFMRAQDFSNGDACFSMIENGEVTYTSYVHRATGKIVHTDHITNTVTQTVVEPAVVSPQPFALNSFSTQGYITYDWYLNGVSSPSGTRRIRVQSMKEYEVIDHYRLNRTFHNFADLASVIATVCGIPGLISGNVALIVISIVALEISFIDKKISDACVTMRKTTMSWRFSDATVTSFSATLEGTQFSYEVENTRTGASESKTELQGQWLPENSYSSRNTSFAYRAYTTLWGTDTQAVLKSWS